jgi:hypothetical protein
MLYVPRKFLCGMLLVAACRPSERSLAAAAPGDGAIEAAVPDGAGLDGLAADSAVDGSGPDAAHVDAGTLDVPGHTPGDPGAAAHGLVFYRQFDPDHGQDSSIATPPLITQPSGGTMIVNVGRGDITAFALPTDSRGNAPYQQLGATHNYTHFPTSGTALYAFPGASGGANFRVFASTKPGDEITLAVVEVADGTQIQDVQWNEVVQPATPIPVTSRSVTTTGPATLVAFWWGDSPALAVPQTAVPNNGFTPIDSVLEPGNLVQCAVAVKNVTAAGTYNVTWTSTPVQGAQLWLVAVQ